MAASRENLDTLPRAALQGIINYLPLKDVAQLKNTSKSLRQNIIQCQAPTQQSYQRIFNKLSELHSEKKEYKKVLTSWNIFNLLIKLYQIDQTGDTISPISLRQLADGANLFSETVINSDIVYSTLSQPSLSVSLFLIAQSIRGVIRSFEIRSQALNRAEIRIPILDQAIDLIAEVNHPKMRM